MVGLLTCRVWMADRARTSAISRSAEMASKASRAWLAGVGSRGSGVGEAVGAGDAAGRVSNGAGDGVMVSGGGEDRRGRLQASVERKQNRAARTTRRFIAGLRGLRRQAG